MYASDNFYADETVLRTHLYIYIYTFRYNDFFFFGPDPGDVVFY